MCEKRIEICKMRVGDLKHNFGNPRKISKSKKKELSRSLEQFGDFGIFLIDEKDNVIAGNQRSTVLNEKDPDIVVDCKRLIGYTTAELKAINIKDNTHSGEWDLNVLAEWTADLNIDLGLDMQEKEPADRKINLLEPIRYEKYDYIMIVCRSELDYEMLVKKFNLEDKKVLIAKKKNGERTIKARAIWYEDVPEGMIIRDVVPEKLNCELIKKNKEDN